MLKEYDYVVIGSGPAGHVSAIKAALSGLRTAVIEKKENMFGGVCLNEGCIPAKSLFHSAELIQNARKADKFFKGGLNGGDIDVSELTHESQRSVELLKKGLRSILNKNGIDLIIGEASFVDKNVLRIESGTEDTEVMEIHSSKILIATGSKSFSFSNVHQDSEKIITSSEAIALESVPGNILIVGGGAIGVEFASFFNILGSKVTIIEMKDDILPTEDSDVSRGMRSLLKRKGVEVITGCQLSEAVNSPADVKVKIVVSGEEKERSFEKILLSAGRVPFTEGLGLDKLGVELDGKGYIKVDEELRTNIKNIYAAGDVINSPMLAHAAQIEGETAAASASNAKPETIEYGNIPFAVYSEIKASGVGLTEKDAKEKGLDYGVGKVFFRSNGRAVACGDTEGFVKVIADNKTKLIYGVHILGKHSDELIHEFVLAKKMGISVDDISKTVHAHPTFSEIAIEACRAVSGDKLMV